MAAKGVGMAGGWQPITTRAMGRSRVAVAMLIAGSSPSIACAPTVNVFGTYFPASLASAAIGLVSGYLVVRLMAGQSALRPLAQSALFFIAVVVSMGFVAWWGLFRDF